tara:strand:+ start:439 stop:888 length:450 start_codon:yes stop_codon:yes gene_type:complete
MKIFEKLAQEDLQLLLDAPALITILIGSADGHLDEDEIKGGYSTAHIKENTEERILKSYYHQVSESFDERIKFFIASLPTEAKARNEEISAKLNGLNKVYESLDQNFVEQLNKSFRSFAHQVAKASGGILGFGSESYEEKQWVDLSMIK